MKRTFTFLVFAILIYSCEKEDDVLNYLVTYVGNRVVYLDEINDPNVIRKFSGRYDTKGKELDMGNKLSYRWHDNWPIAVNTTV